jgi:hypothetical protein
MRIITGGIIQRPYCHRNMNRRSIIHGFLILPMVFAFRPTLSASLAEADIDRMQKDWAKLLPTNFSPPAASDTVQRPEEEWRQRLVQLRDEVRQRNRLAQLPHPHTRRNGHQDRFQVSMASHRVPLRPLRGTSGSCVQGRPSADQ